jgi:hypothetical protein
MPSWSSTWNGSFSKMPFWTYSPRNLPASSRLKPQPICVRSFVPKEKNSAVSAILSAVTAARGISIIVPTRYSMRSPRSAKTFSAISRMTFSWLSSSPLMPTSGTMISGWTSMPSPFTFRAASIIPRACISVTSG